MHKLSQMSLKSWREKGASPFHGVSLFEICFSVNCYGIWKWRVTATRTHCREKWGLSNCHRSKGSIVHIGVGEEKAEDEETNNIDAASWNERLFCDGTSLEYTTNSISYFRDGLDIVIDITGYGVNDTCNKKIRIPLMFETSGCLLSNCIISGSYE